MRQLAEEMRLREAKRAIFDALKPDHIALMYRPAPKLEEGKGADPKAFQRQPAHFKKKRHTRPSPPAPLPRESDECFGCEGKLGEAKYERDVATGAERFHDPQELSAWQDYNRRMLNGTLGLKEPPAPLVMRVPMQTVIYPYEGGEYRVTVHQLRECKEMAADRLFGGSDG